VGLHTFNSRYSQVASATSQHLPNLGVACKRDVPLTPPVATGATQHARGIIVESSTPSSPASKKHTVHGQRGRLDIEVLVHRLKSRTATAILAQVTGMSPEARLPTKIGQNHRRLRSVDAGDGHGRGGRAHGIRSFLYTKPNDEQI
jgi:hypothetical protein